MIGNNLSKLVRDLLALTLMLTVFLLSCSTGSDAGKNTREYQVQQNYDHPFFHTQTWSYPWFMVQHEDGTLESTMSDSLGNAVIDTTRLYHTALCKMNDYEDHVIHYAKANLNNDTLLLSIAEGTASSNDRLTVVIKNGKVRASYHTVYFFYYKKEDLSFKTIRQDLLLNTDDFKKGDTLKGNIDFACIEQWKNRPEAIGPDDKKDTIRIKGPFKCVVE